MSSSAAFSGRHYTLERDGRELQLDIKAVALPRDYTLERDGRELQPSVMINATILNYTLERDGRELQLGCLSADEVTKLYP